MMSKVYLLRDGKKKRKDTKKKKNKKQKNKLPFLGRKKR